MVQIEQADGQEDSHFMTMSSSAKASMQRWMASVAMRHDTSDRWLWHRAALAPVAARLSPSVRSGGAVIEPHDAAVPDRPFLLHHGLLMLWRRHVEQAAQPCGVRIEIDPNQLAAARLHALAQQRAVRRVAEAWDDEGIPWLVLKSLGYRDEIYEAPELRPSSDIDLLVMPKDRERALAVLAGLGATRLDRGSAHECMLRLDATDIDLHWDLLAPGRLPTKFAASVIARRVRRGAIFRPDDTDALMFALVHPAFAKHVCSEHMGLNRVADLLLMLDRFDVDEARLSAQLHAAGVATAAWAVLEWTRMISPVEPARLVRLHEALAPGALRRRYIRIWLRDDWPGRLMPQAPIVTVLAFLSLLHDRPRDVTRAVVHRLQRRRPS